MLDANKSYLCIFKKQYAVFKKYVYVNANCKIQKTSISFQLAVQFSYSKKGSQKQTSDSRISRDLDLLRRCKSWHANLFVNLGGCLAKQFGNILEPSLFVVPKRMIILGDSDYIRASFWQAGSRQELLTLLKFLSSFLKRC